MQWKLQKCKVQKEQGYATTSPLPNLDLGLVQTLRCGDLEAAACPFSFLHTGPYQLHKVMRLSAILKVPQTMNTKCHSKTHVLSLVPPGEAGRHYWELAEPLTDAV